MQRFVRAKANAHVEAGTLVAASYWAGLRQAIYVAVTNREPLSIDTIDSLADRTLTEASEEDGQTVLCIHCADVITLCFGAPETSFVEKWERLECLEPGVSEAAAPVLFSDPF